MPLASDAISHAFFQERHLHYHDLYGDDHHHHEMQELSDLEEENNLDPSSFVMLDITITNDQFVEFHLDWHSIYFRNRTSTPDSVFSIPSVPPPLV